MGRLSRREMILAGLGVAASSGVTSAGKLGAYSFHFDHILGTSLDCSFTTSDPAAVRAAESLILDEIERLRLVFSPFDPESELSRFNQSAGPFPASPDLIAVLRLYDHWQGQSAGACDSQLGELIEVWAAAEKRGAYPDTVDLPRPAKESTDGWRIDAARRTVTRLTTRPLNLNSIAKGYILGCTAAVVRATLPTVSGGLINLGGDLCAWGDSGGAGWLVGIQDPFRPEENARPLTAIRLDHAAVATSGGYQRFFTIGGRRHSHILDPRTGRPADGVAGATVVAADAVTANVLATTLCVLGPVEGLALVAATPGVECLIVDAAGNAFRSGGFASLECVADPPKDPPPASTDAKSAAWPEDFQVTISIELPRPMGRFRRPYVAVWVEDAAGKAVRSLTVWGDSRRWQPELSGWWKLAKEDSDLIKAVTRATRIPGKYEVVWDGKDNKGKTLPRGTYTVKVEVNREHGKHVTQSGKLVCGAEPATVKLEKNAEAGETVVGYGKKEKKK